jgi:hypothetical protein
MGEPRFSSRRGVMQMKSRRLTNLVPKKYSLPKDYFGREI